MKGGLGECGWDVSPECLSPSSCPVGSICRGLGRGYVRVRVPTLRLPGGRCSLLLEGVGFGEVRVSFDRSSVEAGQVFEVPPGDSADRMWPEAQLEARGCDCAWWMGRGSSYRPCWGQNFSLAGRGGGGEGRRYSVRFVLSKEAQWYFEPHGFYTFLKLPSDLGPWVEPPPDPALPQEAKGLACPSLLCSTQEGGPVARGQDLARPLGLRRPIPWSPALGGACPLTSLHRATHELAPFCPLFS